MVHKKGKKEPGNSTYASVKKEMAKPCMAKSARIAERNLDTARVPKQPSATIPGKVNKNHTFPSEPTGKAQIAVDRADHQREVMQFRGARYE